MLFYSSNNPEQTRFPQQSEAATVFNTDNNHKCVLIIRCSY